MMKKFFLLFCLAFVCCSSEFQDNVVYYDFDVGGEYILSNGEQDILLAEKCYYFGKGEYECGLTAVGLTGNTRCVDRGVNVVNGHVHRCHLKTLDFSKVIVEARDGSTHRLLSYTSDRMFAYDAGSTFHPDYSPGCIIWTIFFDEIDLVQGQSRFMDDLLLMKSDSSGLVEIDITDSEGNKVHLVYQMERPQITDSFVFEEGGFYIDPKEIKLLLDYCDFTIDSVFVSDSLLQECLENCFFCGGVLPMANRRELSDFYNVYGYNIKRREVEEDESYFYDAKQEIKSRGLYHYSVTNMGVRNVTVQVPHLDVPYVYYKPR